MNYFNWNPDKNEWLKEHRGVSFEQVVWCIENGFLLNIIEHPNTEHYGRQKIFVVNMEEYAYWVPFVESETGIFLKTIIPSRKATKEYLGGKDEA